MQAASGAGSHRGKRRRVRHLSPVSCASCAAAVAGVSCPVWQAWAQRTRRSRRTCAEARAATSAHGHSVRSGARRKRRRAGSPAARTYAAGAPIPSYYVHQVPLRVGVHVVDARCAHEQQRHSCDAGDLCESHGYIGAPHHHTERSQCHSWESNARRRFKAVTFTPGSGVQGVSAGTTSRSAATG